MGEASIDNLFINAVIPVRAAYQFYTGKEDYLAEAYDGLSMIKAEQNRITRNWKNITKDMKTAADSQAGYQLFTHYCSLRKCMSCQIGIDMIKATS